MSVEKDKKFEQTEITYSVADETFSGSWAPATESVSVSYGVTPSGASIGSVDTMDIGEMMRADAGKGMENFTFDDYLPAKPFEDSVPSLAKIEEMCDEYPSLRIAYEKFRNVWRICYTDYCSKNPNEEIF